MRIGDLQIITAVIICKNGVNYFKGDVEIDW